MLLALYSTALVLCNVVFCLPEFQNLNKAYALKSSNLPSQRWVKAGSPAPDQIISLQIGLKQGKFDEVLKQLNEGKIFLVPCSVQLISKVSLIIIRVSANMISVRSNSCSLWTVPQCSRDE
jgi:hypothetical protein